MRIRGKGEVGGVEVCVNGMPTLALEWEISLAADSDRWLEQAPKGLHDQGFLLVPSHFKCGRGVKAPKVTGWVSGTANLGAP